MNVTDLSQALHRRQRVYISRASDAAAQLWAGVDGADIAGTWAPQVARTVGMVASGKRYAASGVTDYTSGMLRLQGVVPEPAGTVQADAFGASASDGRPLGSLLYMPAVHSQQALAAGVDEATALQVGLSSLQMIVSTEVADAGRSAVGVAMVSDPHVTGFIRVPSGSACDVCAVLAGAWYSTEDAAEFERHPGCGCTAAPAADSESIAPAMSSPDAYFQSLSAERQDQVFGQADAQAIRDGADMSQVVNTHRGISAPRQWTTTEGTTKSGVYGGYTVAGQAGKARMTPEGIYALSSTRDEALSLLRQYGYLR